MAEIRLRAMVEQPPTSADNNNPHVHLQEASTVGGSCTDTQSWSGHSSCSGTLKIIRKRVVRKVLDTIDEPWPT